MKKNTALSCLMHLLECIFIIHNMSLKLEKTSRVFFKSIFLYLKNQCLVDGYTFFLLNINTLISSLIHFSHLFDYLYMQKIHSWSLKKNFLCLTKHNRISYQNFIKIKRLLCNRLKHKCPLIHHLRIYTKILFTKYTQQWFVC